MLVDGQLLAGDDGEERERDVAEDARVVQLGDHGT